MRENKSPFLDLPPELRLIIYGFLPTKARHVKVQFQEEFINRIHGHPHDHNEITLIVRSLPAIGILATCRKIHDEAKAVLLSKLVSQAPCVIVPCTLRPLRTGSSRPSYRAIFAHLVFQEIRHFPFLNSWRFQTIRSYYRDFRDCHLANYGTLDAIRVRKFIVNGAQYLFHRAFKSASDRPMDAFRISRFIETGELYSQPGGLNSANLVGLPDWPVRIAFDFTADSSFPSDLVNKSSLLFNRPFICEALVDQFDAKLQFVDPVMTMDDGLHGAEILAELESLIMGCEPVQRYPHWMENLIQEYAESQASVTSGEEWEHEHWKETIEE
ncbi:unnamed protein product [Periconia digitata]|uniref:2EXR domain-containing protein n=1 Tax=Periconia digitata TaxID=1303443 RepID=A0A9W4ULG2_9PLEO|nr:unnamed protein product [Periconia digitata]